MPNVSNLQSSFQGGEWAPYTQGRMDRPDYRSGLAVCLNAIPVEEGAWTRRPGFRRLGYTRAGAYGSMKEFHFNQDEPYTLELTHLHMRMWGGSPLGLNSSNLIVENETFSVASINTATPAEVTTLGDHGWTTGDSVMFRMADGETDAGAGHILNRQFYITVTDTDEFTINDATTGDLFDGNDVTIPATGLFVARIYDVVTPWTAAEVEAVRTVQDDKTLLMFHKNHAPRRLFNTQEPSTCENAEFTFTSALLLDGPYFDPYDNAPAAQADGLSGTVEVTLGSSAYPFVSTDVGRAIRLFSEPEAWDAATAYVAGDSVKYQSAYYTLVAATSTGEEPTIYPAVWSINPAAAQWAWGYIAVVTDATHADVSIGADTPLLYANTDIPTWRMGLYSDTTGWPTGGVFHNGRLYIWGEVIPNRMDGSKSGEGLKYDSAGVYSPTNWDGTVYDNSAVSLVFQSDSTNPIFWASSDDQGLLFGTKNGEWLLRAGASDETITPTSARVRKVSKYGSSNVEPVRVGQALLFVNDFNRKLNEYMASATSSSPRFTASNITLKAKHLTATGISQVVYQQELVPMLWLRTAAGGLVGCTYKKDGDYSGIKEDIQGWTSNSHGGSRTFESLSGGPTGQGLDTLYAIVSDGTYRHVEQLQLIMGQNAQPATWNGLDSSVVPTAAEITGTAPNESVVYYGFDHLEGETLAVWAAGVDAGDYVVTNGTITVPLVAPFDRTLLSTVTTGSTYFGLAITFSAGSSTLVPAAPDVSGITEYQVGAEVLAAPGNEYVPDYVGRKVYVVSNGHGTGAGFRRYNMDTGALEDSVDTPTLFPGHGADPSWSVSLGNVDEAGNLYMIADSGNFDAVFKIHGPTLTHVSSLAEPPTYTGAIVNGSTFVPVTLNGRTLVTQAGFFVGAGSSAYINLIDADATPMATVGSPRPLTAGQRLASLARGAVVSVGCAEAANIYVAGRSNTGAPSANVIEFYRLSLTVDQAGVASHGFASIGDIVPSDVDPSWTVFQTGGGVSSFNVDQTDGNLLVHVIGGPGGGTSNIRALVKVNATTLAVMWTLLGHDPDLGGALNSVIKDGRLAYKSATVGGAGQYPVWLIDTIAGTATAGTPAVDVSGTTRWCGVTGFLFGRGQYAQTNPGFPIGTNTSAFTDSFYRFAGTPGSGGLTDYQAPMVAGYNYPSRGQVLRPIFDAGAANGPALGKTRRPHQYAILLQRTGPISIGTDFTSMRPVEFRQADGTAYASGLLYSGIVQDTIEADYNFNGQPAWEITRPGPGTVLAVETFIHAQDR